MFGKKTLWFEDVVQGTISHVKKNKNMGDDMNNEGLLIKGVND